MHRSTVLLRVSTVVAFCAALMGGGVVGAEADLTGSGSDLAWLSGVWVSVHWSGFRSWVSSLLLI